MGKNQEQMMKRAEKAAATITDYTKTFKTEHGKRVLNDLVNEHFAMRSTFSPEGHTMAFNEGQRQVILRIMAMLKMNPTEYLNTIRESDAYVTADN